MSKLATIAFAAIAAIVVAVPAATPAFAVDTRISEKCGPDAPEAYKRPGGYCEQIGANQSTAAKGEGFELMIIYVPYVPNYEML